MLRTGSERLFSYPDAMVVRRPVETMEGRPQVVTNRFFVAMWLGLFDIEPYRTHSFRWRESAHSIGGTNRVWPGWRAVHPG